MALVDEVRKTISLSFVYCGYSKAGVTSSLASIHKEITGQEVNWDEGANILFTVQRALSMFSELAPKIQYEPTVETFGLDLGELQNYKLRATFFGYSLPHDEEAFLRRSKKADGVIFVADSSASMQMKNLYAMEVILRALESPKQLKVVQFNKRDAKDALTCKAMKNQLSLITGVPTIETIACSSFGTLASLRTAMRLTLDELVA